MRTDKAVYAARLIDEFILNIRKNVSTSAYNADLEKMSEADVKQRLNFLLKQYDELNYVTLFDKTGKARVAAVPGLETRPPEEYGRHIRKTPFRRAMDGQIWVFSEVYSSPSRKENLVTLAIPLPGKRPNAPPTL